MTDFVRDLEAELLAAAHRRSARRRTWRLPLRPVLVTATALAVVLAAVTFIPRPAPDERSATPGGFAVPALAAPEICEPAVRLTGPPTKDADAMLAVLNRIPRAGDQLPRLLQESQSTWLPAGTWNGMSKRPAGTDVVVSGTNDVRTRPLACGGGESRGPGACLVALGKTREELRVRCFTTDEILAGRAFAVIDGERLVGLAPDRALEIEVTAGEKTLRLPVRENTVWARVPGLRADENISVRLDVQRPVVLALNQTSTYGLAAELASRMRERLDVTTFADWGKFNTRKRTFVRPTRPEAESLAMRIAMTIGAGLQPTSKAPPGAPGNPDVVILVGSDRMR